jgi:hypothetical protein
MNYRVDTSLGGAIRGSVGFATRTVRRVGERAGVGPAAERAILGIVDLALDSRIVQEAVDRALTSGVADEVVARVLDGPELERLVDRVLASPGVERAVARVIDSRLMDEGVARLLDSDDLWLLVDEIARSPSVTTAIGHQSVGFADQIAGALRARSRRADDRMEHAARRLVRREDQPPAAHDDPAPRAP